MRDDPRRLVSRLALLLLIGVSLLAQGAEPQRPQPLKSGIEFAGGDIQQLQGDDFANPGMLWIERGAKSWSAPAGVAGKSCAECHGGAATSMKGVSARYPRWDDAAGRVVNLEQRINVCRARHQQAPALEYESDDLLGLTAYVANQSRGMPLAVAIDGPARASFERGSAHYHKRVGQMNLACTQCHDRNWGRKLAAETISQGHGNGYPTYRLEWQKTGSLDRRIRACFFGVRADMPPFGSQELVDL